jgi:hypothetical protein
MPKFQFKNSTTPGAVPASLQQGEIAINIPDKKTWIGNASNVPVLIVQSLGNQDANNVTITGGSVSVTNHGTTTPAAVSTSSLSVGGTAVTQVSNDTTMNNANYTNSATNSFVVTQNAAKTYHDNTLKGRLKNIFTFTSSGTYTRSGTDVNQVHVICVGAGGGGTSYNIGGGAGGYSEGIFTAAQVGTSQSVTVSSSGSSGATYYANIGAGGTTSFGGLISATGGYGADANYGHASGHGGYGYGGNLNSKGGTNGGHSNEDQRNPSSAYDCGGGVGYFGGGMSTFHTSRQGTNVGAFGAGGGTVAGNHNGQGGYTGQGGICIVYEYR